MDRTYPESDLTRRFPTHGWLGFILILIFWPLNWGLDGLRTHWGFFPLWVGYSLAVDGINYYRRGTSLLHRNWRLYVGLFFISAPIWWSFELVNWRTRNWLYLGREFFSDLEYLLLASLSFSTVIPAVMGTAELFAGFEFIRRLGRGPVIPADRPSTRLFYALGLGMFITLFFWPQIFFPFTWTFMLFMIEPINVWLGNRSLFDLTSKGDWRPILALWLGVLVCGFFWEMFQYLASSGT